MAVQWLTWEAAKNGCAIRHQVNGRQKRISKLPVDGRCPETSTAYQFHGCFCHGCPKCYDQNETNSVSGKTMATLLEKTRCNTAYLRRHVKVVEMWDCEWKEVRNESDVKTFLAPSSRPRWTMTQQQILAAVVDGTLFGMVECDVRVPEELQDYFSEMQPVFKNASVTRDEIGPFMRQYVEEHDILSKPRVMLVGNFRGVKILLATPLLRWYLTSVLYKLDPYVDDYGLLWVGGRIDKCNLPHDVKHPVILPKVGHLTTLIVRHFHEKTSHQGRGITANEIRASGICIVGCRAVVSGYIRRCVICRRFRGALHTQKMAQLPDDRLQCTPPFTYCAVDYFGPFNIKDRRSVVPRYGVLFTCMMSRAIHLETANSLENDSFINALRRFIAIRGPVRQLRCDRGTNFVGANNQLNRELASMTNRKVAQFLLDNNCDFKFNVPSASHMGGVWERQIRTVRSVLVPMLEKSGSQLYDESLRTLLSEVMCIVNSRPLSVNEL